MSELIPPRKVTVEEFQRAIKEYEKGYSLDDAVTRTGINCSHVALRKAFIRNNIPIRRIGLQANPEKVRRHNRIIDLYQNYPEITLEQIADRFGITVAAIHQILYRNNIPHTRNNTKMSLEMRQKISCIQKERHEKNRKQQTKSS